MKMLGLIEAKRANSTHKVTQVLSAGAVGPTCLRTFQVLPLRLSYLAVLNTDRYYLGLKLNLNKAILRTSYEKKWKDLRLLNILILVEITHADCLVFLKQYLFCFIFPFLFKNRVSTTTSESTFLAVGLGAKDSQYCLVDMKISLQTISRG